MPLNTVLPSSITEEHRRPTHVPADMVLVETGTPGVFEFVEGGEGDAVIEETATAGVYEVTDAPGAGAKARAAAVNGVGVIIGR